jgi:hypothetical protein
MLRSSSTRGTGRGRPWLISFLILMRLASLAAQDPDSSDAEVLKAENLPSLWVKDVTLRTWAGYKDNILLANQNIIGSPLLAAGADLTMMRIPINGWECLLFASGEYTRYLTSSQVHQESLAIGQAQLKKTIANSWTIGLSGEYLFFDQVFDNSIVSTQLVALPVDGNGFTLRPSLKKQFDRGYHLELEAPATRQIFDQFIDDYWETGPKLSFGREYGHKSDLSLSYQFNYRRYDTQAALDASGNALAGKGLDFYQHELLLGWRQIWDADGRWRTVTRLSLQRNDDNGGGYYNFWRPYLSEQLRYQRSGWEVRAEAKLAYYHYDLQRIADLASPIRHKLYLRLGFRAEKALTKSLKLFGQYEFERAASNLSFDQYKVNTVFGGLEWER